MRAHNEAELIERDGARPVLRTYEGKDIFCELGQHDVMLAYREFVRAYWFHSMIARDLIQPSFRDMVVHIVEGGTDPTDRIGLEVHDACAHRRDVRNVNRLSVDPKVIGPKWNRQNRN